jgi:hypothetical protein
MGFFLKAVGMNLTNLTGLVARFDTLIVISSFSSMLKYTIGSPGKAGTPFKLPEYLSENHMVNSLSVILVKDFVCVRSSIDSATKIRPAAMGTPLNTRVSLDLTMNWEGMKGFPD